MLYRSISFCRMSSWEGPARAVCMPDSRLSPKVCLKYNTINFSFPSNNCLCGWQIHHIILLMEFSRYRCIDDRSLCDGFFDCPGQEDESPEQCLFYKTVRDINLFSSVFLF